MLKIRPATEAEHETARQMLKAARLDPTTPLNFDHTLVADVDGKIVGVGQIKHHRGCQELGSLVVLPEYRRQGIAGQLIEALMAQAERPLYLTCRNRMVSYYERFGFRRFPYAEVPSSLKLKLIITVLPLLFGIRIRVLRKDS